MKQIILVFIILIIATNCKKDNTKISIMDYPMEIGSEWIYDRQVVVTKFEINSSDVKIAKDTINFVVKVWIDRDTIFNDTMSVKVFKAQEDNENWTSTHYNFKDNEGLKTYAYSNASLVVFPKKGVSWNLYTAQFNTSFRLKTSEEIFYESPPTLNIKFPHEENSIWTFRSPSDSGSLQIDKKVIGMEQLEVNNLTLDCSVIKWIYLYDSSFEKINITDWIAEEGLIKRLTTIDTITVTNEHGEPLYKAHFTEVLKLRELKIN